MFVLPFGCSNVQPNSKSDLEEAKKAIAESNGIYFNSFAKNDSSIFIDRYAKDCCIMAPNAPSRCGPNTPLEFFKMAYCQFGLRGGKFITQEVFGVGDGYVAETGLWQSINAEGKMFDDGKFLVLWKKTPKGWKMFRDSFSSNHKEGY
ncbi:MAG: nuclear transport factor 2 family protein [Bacteroidetes bacterium]|nr:nuclear transport factor 2 family protein [Bacteroidota bacterium]